MLVVMNYKMFQIKRLYTKKHDSNLIKNDICNKDDLTQMFSLV